MRGISFPFRIGIRGGVAMSEDSYTALPHLHEALQQVIGTSVGERPMLPEFGSEVDTSIFETDSQSSRTMLEFQVKGAIEAHLKDIVNLHEVTSFFEGSVVSVNIKYSSREFATQKEFENIIKVGDINA